MGERFRAHRWNAGPSGPPAGWCPELGWAASYVLESALPSLLMFGPQLLIVPNDALLPLLADDADVMGTPLARLWALPWTSLDDMVARMTRGESLSVRWHAPAAPGDEAADTLIDLSCSPVRMAAGPIVGFIGTVLDLSEQVRARHALEETERNLRALASQAEVGILTVDTAGCVLWANAGLARSAGASWGDLVGHPLRDIIHPTDWPQYARRFAHLLQTGSGFASELRTGGEAFPRWHRLVVHARRTPGLGIVGASVAVIDITERRWAESTLRLDEERQAYLLNLSDALRPLDAPERIRASAMHALAGHLGLDADGVVFDDARRGDAARHADVDAGDAGDATSPAPSGRRLAIPLTMHDHVVAVVRLEADVPRQWSEAERSLALETAERTWLALERAGADAALRERTEWLAGQRDAFQAALNGASLEESLGILVRTVLEHQDDGVRCAFYMADPAGSALRHLVGMPERYALCVDGLRIGPDSFACGLAVHLGEAVITPDVTLEPRWQPWMWMAHEHDFQGVWSFPVKTFGGRVGATFAMYFRQPRTPVLRDHELAAVMTRSAGIIIARAQEAEERARAEHALRESEERLRRFGEASQDVLWIRDADTLQWSYLTQAFEQVYGLPRAHALAGADTYAAWLDLVLPIDRQRVAANIERVRRGEQVTFEYRVRRPIDGAIRWLRNTDFPILDASGRVALVGGISHDATDLHDAERRFRLLVEGMPQLVWRAVTAGVWAWASPQWTDYTGQDEAASHGWGWLDALHPDDRELARTAWQEAPARGGFDVEYRVFCRADRSHRWFQTRATPVRDDAGDIVEWLGTSTDIHELRNLQEHQRVLLAELQHRTRNLIGVVRSIGDRTLRSTGSLAEFQERFSDRLDALARVQGLLSRLGDHDRVTFDELVGAEFAAIEGSGSVVFDGPGGVRLRSSTVQTLAMALHELATNAIKYGALGQPSGRLDIGWRLDMKGGGAPPWLHIDWRESGVRMPDPDALPQGTGQGRELIERALPYQLGAETTYVLGPDGVHCTISIPVSQSTRGEMDHE